MTKKHAEHQDESSSSEEEEKFHVEVIKKARVNGDANWEYLWAGYDSDADSWEPSENVQECKRLLQSFWEDIGTDDMDYLPGYEVSASPAWIAKERKFFRRNFGKQLHKDETRKDSTAKHIPGKATKVKPKTKKPGWIYVTESEAESEEETSPKPEKKVEKKRKKHAKTSIVDSTDSGSEPEEPLRKVARLSKVAGKQVAISKADKGKGVALRTPHRTLPAAIAQPADDVESLFSAPSSPDIGLASRRMDQSMQAGPSGKPATKKDSEPKPADKAGPSASTAPPVKHVGSHKDRVPKVKPIDIPMQTGHAISTKARIASGGIAGKPKLTLDTPSAIQNQQKEVLRGLSFKKKHTADSAKTATPTSATATDPRRPLFIPEKDVLQEGGLKQMTAVVGWGGGDGHDPGGWGQPPAPPLEQRPPVAQRRGTDAGADKSAHQRRPLPRRSTLGSIQTSPPQSAINDSHAADQFLSSIMPAQLAAPMREPLGVELPAEIVPPKTLVAKKPPIERIQKQWKWNAELYIDKGGGVADRICNISLTDATNPRPEGLRLSILYKTETSILRFEKFHSVSDVSILFRACAPIQQFCKLTYQDAGDAEALEILARYMTRKRLFTYAHVSLDQDPLGILFVYPSAMTDLSKFLQVPPEIQEGTRFIAALLMWSVTADDYKKNAWFPTRRQLYAQGGRLDSELKKRLAGSHKLSNALFALGLRIHRFTCPAYDFLGRTPRDYCLWYSPVDGTSNAPGFETKTLQAVLSACKARNVGYKADVRVIFVHVGALKTFHSLVALGMRRCKQPDLRIYSYGTHETIPPDRWGLREIYPIGGIVTFTPLAIAQNPVGVFRLINRSEEHPLWASFIHPCTVAAVAKITSPDHDPVQLLEDGGLFCEQLLRLIEDGKISLLPSLPLVKREVRTGSQFLDPRMEWVAWVAGTSPWNAKTILVQCMKQLDERFSKTPIRDLSYAVEKETMSDFRQLQCQPAIMDNYRRFVLITESRNDAPDTCKDGVELTTTFTFSFKDDFFLD
ncbi:hypothetical protein NM688_g6118 [Phlebia brevispora]|uniref:Uncharacterized protein n=1 Tax=Phlebia brevispora TaxID=194682 RepID=A0ACC1SJU2_9APHY|nr:hypothetical protein NM688_g6118 [Phlebia brevispora]